MCTLSVVAAESFSKEVLLLRNSKGTWVVSLGSGLGGPGDSAERPLLDVALPPALATPVHCLVIVRTSRRSREVGLRGGPSGKAWCGNRTAHLPWSPSRPTPDTLSLP